MDSYREHPSDFDAPSAGEIAASEDVAAAIGTDERRMHVRAYNYWVALLDGRDFPSIEDLEPGDVQDFSAHSVLLDFTCGGDNPAIPYIGAAIRDECALNDDTRTIADVPSRSLLSRLTDHYMQIIANRAPVGFEAEFENPHGDTICYRGILMPFSSDGDTIDFIYGVINWKHVEDSIAGEPLAADEAPVEAETQVDDFAEPIFETEPDVDDYSVEDDQPLELTEVAQADEIEPDAPMIVPEESSDEEFAEVIAEPLLADDAGLADRLWAARETAETVKAGEGRTRAALYQALSLAYDFALAAHEYPEEYAELLEESGVKAQVRAPMTPIVKLVFGIDYDKARLTEFAAALSYAQRQAIGLGAFQDFIGKQPGGLKSLVAAERQARRPEPKADTKGEQARARLRTAAPISLEEVPAADEFAVVVTRRGADGRHQLIAIVEDEALIERAIRRAA
jgi:hypothetical protein